jgi:hypothetical protein
VVLTPVQNTDLNALGDLVSSLLAGAVTDVDTAALQGIAVVTANAKGIGVWEFSVNGGATWLELGPVSASKARLLRAQDRVRFRPLAGLVGTATLGYRAWDQTSGFAGSLVAPGGTAFSLATDIATLTVL